MATTEFENQEKVTRQLLLRSPKDLEEIGVFISNVALNILQNTTDIRVRTIRASALTKRKQELEADKMILKLLGFSYKENHGEKLESVWILPLPEKNLGAQMSKLRDGLEWFKDTIKHLLDVARKSRCPEDARIAATTVKLTLPNKQTVEGGFLRDEKVADVVTFARFRFEPKNRQYVQLREPHNAQPLTQGEKPLAEFGPRVLLMASVLDEQARENKMQEAHKEEDPERLKRKEATIKHQKEVKEKQEKEAAFRQQQLDQFRENQEKNNPVKRRRLGK